VLRFVAITALGLVTAGAAILVIVNHSFAREAQRQANEHARFAVGSVLGPKLRPSDFRIGLTAERRQRLRRLMSPEALGSASIAASLYDRNGQVTFTSKPRLDPGDAPTTVRQSLTGKVVSQVASTPAGRVMSTFVPIRSSDGRTIGVFRIDRDYGPIAAAASHSSLVVASILEALLLLLCALLVPVLARAAGRLRRHVDELDHLATHDELTGLLNRLGFKRELDKAAGGAREAALLLFDLADFHEINNALGSASSDALLVEVATGLQAHVEGGVAGRLGEDEFGILAPTRDRRTVTEVGRTLTATFVEPVSVGGVQIAIEPRIGAALIPDHGSDGDEVLRRAGIALTAAKERQTGLEIFDPSHDTADRRRVELTSELREALEARQLVVHYQPQADLTTRAIRGVEALVRWEHPTRGMLMPEVFIPLAERSGLITELDRYVLEQAVVDWQDICTQGVVVDLAVNLSPVDLLDAEYAEQIDDLLNRHVMLGEYLVLEVTERTLIGDDRRTLEGVRRLSATGVRLSIDDFGTGYSSLAYLSKLPFRQVKLDRLFVAEMPADPGSDAIVRATIELAHTFNATVVAEGVETRAQWEHLRALGCNIAQGFFVGRPQPAADLIELLTEHPGRPVLVAA
jgi:diguanylate cyclase (GGDEF)-like protein